MSAEMIAIVGIVVCAAILAVAAGWLAAQASMGRGIGRALKPPNDRRKRGEARRHRR